MGPERGIWLWLEQPIEWLWHLYEIVFSFSFIFVKYICLTINTIQYNTINIYIYIYIYIYIFAHFLTFLLPHFCRQLSIISAIFVEKLALGQHLKQLWLVLAYACIMELSYKLSVGVHVVWNLYFCLPVRLRMFSIVPCSGLTAWSGLMLSMLGAHGTWAPPNAPLDAWLDSRLYVYPW